MSILWRCPCCGRRHFGRCEFAAVIVKMLEVRRDIELAREETLRRNAAAGKKEEST